MPKVEQNNNNISTSSGNSSISSNSSSIPISLHHALTNSQCSKCGKQLEWEADFNNITQPKYISKHCNQDYIIRIDTVKVETIEREDYPVREGEKKQKQVHDLPSSIEEEEVEPRAIKMAQALQKEERESEQIDVNPEKIIKEEEKRQPQAFKEEE
jgi:NAD-dependent SIR2 family protein deacetylase